MTDSLIKALAKFFCDITGYSDSN